MSDSFKSSLRNRTSEQLLNMKNNQADWSKEQYSLILEEIDKRGIAIYEDSEPWDEDEMNNLNLLNPQTQFEKDLAFISKHNAEKNALPGLQLAAKILAPLLLILIFGAQILLGYGDQGLFAITLGLGIGGVLLQIFQKHLASVILSSVSLLFFLYWAFTELERWG